ncbi:MAG: type VI secretion system protein TssA [Methyloprofundus sp.]|nr:type VI secretion system protein TssA [Methyloprofundus sp.]
MAIDLEVYLTEIEPDNVCGDDLEYDPEFIAFISEVQGKEEQAMGNSVIEAEPPNWREIKKQAEKLLTRTRDLRIFVNYLRALTEMQGILGLADGLSLLKSVTEKHWENIHPQLDPDDDNDPTERINILMTLGDFDSFLKPLQKLPLVESQALGRFSLRDIQIANGSVSLSASEADAELPQLAIIDGAFQECPAEALQATANAAEEGLKDLNQMESFITEQVGVSNAPSFSELRKYLTDINKVLAEQIEIRGLNESAQESNDDSALGDSNMEQSTAVKATKTSALPGINSDQDVIKALTLISEHYKKNEPSSPIPLLLERVSRLVGKDFMEVLQDMAPNGVEQVEFLRGSSDE